MNAKRNRSAGFAWEREGVKDFSVLYPGVRTSREVSRYRDAEKVDLAYPDESRSGRLPYNPQYKTLARLARYPLFLSEMPQGGPEMNVFMHKMTEKKGDRFMTTGKYTIMNYGDFFKLATYRRGYEILINAIAHMPSATPYREQAIEELKEIGL